MPIGITEEHEALHGAVRGWAERHCPPAVAAGRCSRPSTRRARRSGTSWRRRAGSGSTSPRRSAARATACPELAVVLEELGRALAPGPVPADRCWPRAVLQAAGKDAAAELLPALVGGEVVGAVALAGALDVEAAGDDGALRRSRGTARPVLGRVAGRPRVVAARPADGDDEWCVLVDGRVRRDRAHERSTPPGASPTSPSTVPWSRRRAGSPRSTPTGCATSPPCCSPPRRSGGAEWCVDTAAAYAKDARAVRPADRPVPGREAPLRRHARRARAGPGRGVGRRPRAPTTATTLPLAAASRPRLALDAAFERGQGLHPGARRHRLHLGARRPPLPASGRWRLRQLLGGARRRGARACRRARARRARAGASRVDLPPEAEARPRARSRAFVADGSTASPTDERRRRIADAGLPRRRTGRRRGAATPAPSSSS